MTNPYLEPVTSVSRRVAGWVLIVAGAGLTAVLVYQVFGFLSGANGPQRFTSSTLIFALILVALCGMCWQAGYRLAFNRPDRTGTLFSRPAWLVIGVGLIVITTIMASVIHTARGLTALDVQVMLFLGGIGVWCVVLALRPREQGEPRDSHQRGNRPGDTGS